MEKPMPGEAAEQVKAWMAADVPMLRLGTTGEIVKAPPGRPGAGRRRRHAGSARRSRGRRGSRRWR
ncbi:hypothetical protein [Spongiactinospora rosea]|uniref:hypothetical protein n=1 Tax=Spongiactinospora rosea TaxID=2248750 RepID=UPI0021F0C522|nr:hypothetical protein [Spongiactinospora rosea]